MNNNNCIDKTNNKVYINPNFNRTSVNSIQPCVSTMHVNPRFSQFIPNVQPNSNPKTRIYVNPNFMKTNVGENKLQSSLIANSVKQTTVLINSNSLYFHEQSSVKKDKNTIAAPIPKSKYCLVRPNVTKSCEVPVVERSRNTYQVNKYKSIPLKDIKKNLDNVKNCTSRQAIGTSQMKTKCNLSTSLVNRNQFKLVNPIIATSQIKAKSKLLTSFVNRHQFKFVNHYNLQIDKTKMRVSSDLCKKMQGSQCRVRKHKGQLKKNNIPCPMFRKFGKCLRQIHGNCEFLHDKKHVSICRKFIKGLCHDKDCLLSHDLTKKKMPTCYFYLQGTCTKLDCPYLHVKLSEKVKVCPDFLKGYCEKGGKCLQRHISNQTDKRAKGTLPPKSSPNQKRKYTKVKGKIIGQKDVNEKPQNSRKEKEVKDNPGDCRYYQEHTGNVSENELCEIIKPTRCKLGTLPSFIQL